MEIGEAQLILPNSIYQPRFGNKVTFATEESEGWKLYLKMIAFGEHKVPSALLNPNSDVETMIAAYALGVYDPQEWPPRTVPGVNLSLFWASPFTGVILTSEGYASWVSKVWIDSTGADPQEFLQAVLDGVGHRPA